MIYLGVDSGTQSTKTIALDFDSGETDNTTAPLMARATMEGATLGLAYGLERFRELGLPAREIRLTGGGSKSKVWRQLAADVFGVQTVCLKTAEGAALGAAIQAVWNDDNSHSIAEVSERFVNVDESTRVQPGNSSRAVYDDALCKVKDLTRKLQAGGYL